MIEAGRSILNQCLRLRQHVLPSLCLLCSAEAARDNVCEPCRAELPHAPRERCPRCAIRSAGNALCGACLSRPVHFDRVLAACEYAFPLDRVIQRFKFSGELAAVPLLAGLMRASIEREDARVDRIVPMPLSRERLRERGFNQSVELARQLARDTGIALDIHGLARVRHSEAQSGLPWAERVRNVRGAFVAGADYTGLSVAIVDDVLTTGATLSEAARVLRRAGAERVEGWVAARTPAPEEQLA